MNNPQEDIALIRKYHNGELSPTEKNQLEARALDDPFLQDALDGYEEKGVKEHDIATLNQQLEKRLAPAKVITPVWRLKQWGIAASILFCIALGSIYFNQAPDNEGIALTDIQQKEDISQNEKSKIASLESTDSNELTTIAKVADSPGQKTTDTEPTNKMERFTPEPDIVVEPLVATTAKQESSTELGEARVTGYPSQKKQDVTGAVASMSSENRIVSRMMPADKTAKPVKLKGKIIDQKDSTALPGVSVKNLESGVIKQTDANGEFTIEANQNDNLAFSSLGYETRNKTVLEKDDSILIALAPSQVALSEVVAVGYGTAKQETSLTSGPKVGWRRFKEYVEEQAKITNLGRGKVQVQFVINANGELSDFKINDTFSAKAGVAAINIIKNYNNGWFGSADKVPHKASITIKFK